MPIKEFLKSIAEPLIGVAGGMLSSVYQNEENKELMKMQQEYNLDMWNRQNEYNTPTNQIKRLQEAGINPNSFGMGSNGVQSGGQAAQPLAQSLLPMSDPFNSAANAYLAYTQGKLAKSQQKTEDSMRDRRIAYIDAQCANLLEVTAGVGLDNYYQSIVNEYASTLQELAVADKRADLDIKYWQKNEIIQGLKKMQYELENVLPAQVKEILSREKVNLLELDKFLPWLESTYADIESKYAGAGKSRAEEGLASAQTQTEFEKQGLLQQQSEGQQLSNQDMRNNIELFLRTYEDQIALIANQAKVSTKDVKWYAAKQIISGLSGVASAAGSVGLGFGGAAAGVKALKGLSGVTKVAGFVP